MSTRVRQAGIGGSGDTASVRLRGQSSPDDRGRHPFSPYRLALALLRHRLWWGVWLGFCLAGLLAAGLDLRWMTQIQTSAGLGDALSSSYLSVETLGVASRDAFDSFQGNVDSLAKRYAGDTVAPAVRYATAKAIMVSTPSGQKTSDKLASLISKEPPSLSYYSDLAKNVDVLQGSLSPAAREAGGSDFTVSLAQDQADQGGLNLGDELCFTLGSSPSTQPGACGSILRITALWKAHDPNSGYWGDSLSTFSFMVSESDYFSVASQGPAAAAIAGVRFRANPAALSPEGATDSARRVADLKTEASGSNMTSKGDLDKALTRFSQAPRASSSVLEVLVASLILLVLIQLAVGGVHFFRSAGGDLALLRSRGLSSGLIAQVFLYRIVGLAVIALPIALVMAAASLGVAWWLFPSRVPVSSPSTFEDTMVVLEALAAPAVIFTLLALVVAFRGRAEPAGSSARIAGEPWWQRLYLDFLLVAVSALVLIMPALRDVWGVAVEGVRISGLVTGLALAGLMPITLRLLPLLGAAAAVARPGVAGSLASIQVSRRPEQHYGIAVVLALAVAIGGFALTTVFETVKAGPVAGAAVALAIGTVGFAVHFAALSRERSVDRMAAAKSGFSSLLIPTSFRNEIDVVLVFSVVVGMVLSIVFGLVAGQSLAIEGRLAAPAMAGLALGLACFLIKPLVSPRRYGQGVES